MSIHQDQPVLRSGLPQDQAQAALILGHGRGSNAADILALANELQVEGFVYLAPQAAGGSWYPYRFIEPVERNEPYLTSALQALEELIGVLDAAGLPGEKTMLLGFSQGGCLVLEYAARHPRRYGGVAALSGALIGNGDRPRTYSGSLEGTPVFLGCSDRDPHIPLTRLHDSTQTLRELGGTVDERIYPGMGHAVNEDELDAVRRMMAALIEHA